MNTYRWAELHEGQTESFEVLVGRPELDAFRTLSGDTNPLHAEADFAQRAGYRDIVVFGMLTASYYSRLVGVHLPGQFAVLHGIDIDFTAPTFVGDRLRVTGEIVHLSEATRRIELRARVTNDEGRVLSKAKIRVGFSER
jgi:3-hydroxybutyryl-CoA dehydratase